jgi:5-methylcytosine-specific restriction enzyme subunit McrC
MMVATLELVEREKTTLAAAELTDELGRLIWKRYRSQLKIEFPSPKTEGRWELTPQGYVGYAPVTPDLMLTLRPKVPLSNVFGMLEYAYRLRSFAFLEGRVQVGSIEELFDRLAIVLAGRVSDRLRRGLHRSYVQETDRLPYLRGRLIAAEASRAPWQVTLPCLFDEHTADIEDNQILHWTLDRITWSAASTERSRKPVRTALRGMRSSVSLVPFAGEDCIGRRYDRLNEDYQPMHGLARFFLDHVGPVHERGERSIQPFLVNMDHLFELFVAEWLLAHVPASWGLRVIAQEKYVIQAEGDVHFRIDLMLREMRTGKIIAVLDTKYKSVSQPSADDIAQVVAYGESQHCNDAILIYPEAGAATFDQHVGQVRVRGLTFDLGGDLDEAGESLLGHLNSGERDTRAPASSAGKLTTSSPSGSDEM